MITKQQITDNEDAFRYLYELQSSGRTNMFGAGSYLQSELGLDRQTARTVLTTWMQNYEGIAKELGIEV